MLVFDVSDPANPVQLGTLTPDTYDLNVIEMEIAGNLAHILDGSGSIVTFNVSNLTKPVLLGVYPLSFGDNDTFFPHMQATGNLLSLTLPSENHPLFVNDPEKLGRVDIVDMGDPTSPVLYGRYAHCASGSGDVQVDGDYVYMADYYAGLRIFDTAGPTGSLREESFLPFDNAFSLYVANGLAYIGGLDIVDVSDPANPTVIGRSTERYDPIDIQVVDGFAYLASINDGLVIFDVRDPANPTLVSSYTAPDMTIWQLAVAHNRVYGTVRVPNDTTKYIHIIDIHDPTNPTLTNTLAGNYGSLDISGGLLYVGEPGTGLRIFDLSDPDVPDLLGTAAAAGHTHTDGVHVSEGLAYLISESNTGMHVFDIRNPAAPTLVGYAPDVQYAIHMDTAHGMVYVNDLMDESLDILRVTGELPPMDAPTEQPTDAPTEQPTDAPTEQPTDAPTEQPTDAPTEQPTDTPQVSINYATGKPGSYFTIRGDKFPSSLQLTIIINGKVIVTSTTDNAGAFAITLRTGDTMSVGTYDITVSSGSISDQQMSFTLQHSSALRSFDPAIESDVVHVPEDVLPQPNISRDRTVYVPLVVR